ncbi:MAG: hypothetical protein QG594_2154, partial [Bacteroidota bacterium]|nr:hypothetical protein [Bacteroidota bacterium]
IEETIKPKIFMNQNKERVCIGFTKQAEETLGIVMTSFQKITNENQELKKENYFLKNQISRTNKSSFVKKIKFIFFGMD